jgi:hypothetical protein
LRQLLDETEVARLNETVVPLSPDRSLGLADAVRAWWEHVSKVETDLTAGPADRSVWGAHDLVAALVIRDLVAEGLSRLGPEMSTRVEPVVADVDRRFVEVTEEDPERSIERVDGRSAEGRGWWWGRIPERGPIHDELQDLYGHARH